MAILLLLYVAIGAIAGILAGLLGISGGVVTVPMLVAVFTYQHFPHDYLMHFAIGTSLAAMVFNAISATWSHNQYGAVLWNVFRAMLPGIVIGSILGAVLAQHLSSDFLKLIFGGFECLLGIYFLLPLSLSPKESQKEKLPSPLLLTLMGGGVSALSNVLGIGGGPFMVPALMAIKVPTTKAIGTSAATGFLISLFGALSFLFLGMNKVHFKESIGYLYLPAFIVISITTFLAAPYGAKLAHILSRSILRKVFGGILILTGILMIL